MEDNSIIQPKPRPLDQILKYIGPTRKKMTIRRGSSGLSLQNLTWSITVKFRRMEKKS